MNHNGWYSGVVCRHSHSQMCRKVVRALALYVLDINLTQITNIDSQIMQYLLNTGVALWRTHVLSITIRCSLQH